MEAEYKKVIPSFDLETNRRCDRFGMPCIRCTSCAQPRHVAVERTLDTIRQAGDFRQDGYMVLVYLLLVQYQAPRETRFVVGTYCVSHLNFQVDSNFQYLYGPNSVGKLSDHGAWEDAPDCCPKLCTQISWINDDAGGVGLLSPDNPVINLDHFPIRRLCSGLMYIYVEIRGCHVSMSPERAQPSSVSHYSSFCILGSRRCIFQ